MLKFRCRECDQKIGVPEEWAGHDVRCPRCRSAIPVPKVIDGIVLPKPAQPVAPRPPAPVEPSAPLTPIPGPGRKVVATAAKAQVKPVAVARAGKAPASKPPSKAPAGKPASRVVKPPAPEGAEPAGPIVTEPPSTRDFSSLFAGAGATGVGPADIRVEEPSANESRRNEGAFRDEDTRESKDSARPFSAMLDVLRGPEETGLTSNAAMSDMVKGLTRHVEPATDWAVEAAEPSGRGASVAVEAGNRRARWVGGVAMLVGAVALGLCVIPRATRFALPAGAAGLLIAVIGAMVPGRRRGTEMALALGGSAVSMTGLVLAILVAAGVVPSAATARALAIGRRNVPTARSGDVEVRIVSAAVVRPVVYAPEAKSPQSQVTAHLRVGIEVRNLASKGSVAYRSWGALRPDSEPVILSDDEGNQLKLFDPTPARPVGRPREFPTELRAGSRGIPDVLLFEVPPAAAGELVLQLPGANVQAAGEFDLHIPAGMLRKQ